MLSPKAIQAVAFDMDGLMFNTEDLYDDVTQTVLGRRGHRYGLELKRRLMGLPARQAYSILKESLNLEDSFESFQREMEAIFVGMLPTRIEKMPGLDALLETLDRLQLPKGVATSSSRDFAITALGLFDLIPRFDFILTGDDVTHGKPHPEIYLTSAQKFSVDPQFMLALEDSVNGSRAAVAAGAFTVAIPTVHSRDLDYSHVQFVAESLDDPRIFELF